MNIDLLMKMEFGRQRFYAKDKAGDAALVLRLMKAKCFTGEQVKMMQKGNWLVNISQPAIEI